MAISENDYIHKERNISNKEDGKDDENNTGQNLISNFIVHQPFKPPPILSKIIYEDSIFQIVIITKTALLPQGTK